MSKFDILRKRFNQIPVGEKFDFMDLINDLGYNILHIKCNNSFSYSNQIKME